MNANQRLNPFPGIVILEPYELKRKTGGFILPTEDSENAPQIGKIIDIGKIPIEVTGKFIEWNLTKEQSEKAKKTYKPFEIGMIVAYKKYQDFPIKIGTKEFKAVAFENLLFQIEEKHE